MAAYFASSSISTSKASTARSASAMDSFNWPASFSFWALFNRSSAGTVVSFKNSVCTQPASSKLLVLRKPRVHFLSELISTMQNSEPYRRFLSGLPSFDGDERCLTPAAAINFESFEQIFTSDMGPAAPATENMAKIQRRLNRAIRAQCFLIFFVQSDRLFD